MKMSKIERAIEEFVDNAIENYDFSDAVREGIEDVDFDDVIERFFDNTYCFDDVLERYFESYSLPGLGSEIQEGIESFNFTSLFDEHKEQFERDLKTQLRNELRNELKMYCDIDIVESLKAKLKSNRSTWHIYAEFAGVACIVTGFFEIFKHWVL